MPRSEPGWWYAPPGDSRAWLLAPFARLYAHIVERRYTRQQPYRSRLPVICVGNFTAGGTGKTPLSIAIAGHLLERGERPVFLTRGYGGRLRGPLWVDPRQTPKDVGDEPLLLARVAPVMLARDRRAGAHAIESGNVPATAIIMDDGLQNPALAKDLSIALVDAGRGVGNGRVIPAGPLRAPMEFQLALVDAIVVNGSEQQSERARNILETLRRGFTGPVLQAAAAPAGDVEWLTGANVVAFAGIGHPERFFTLLETLSATIVARMPFPDHHVYSNDDATRLLAAAASASAHLVTTEKDLARLTAATGRCAELREASKTLPIRLAMPAADEARLKDLVATAVETGGYRRTFATR